MLLTLFCLKLLSRGHIFGWPQTIYGYMLGDDMRVLFWFHILPFLFTNYLLVLIYSTVMISHGLFISLIAVSDMSQLAVVCWSVDHFNFCYFCFMTHTWPSKGFEVIPLNETSCEVILMFSSEQILCIKMSCPEHNRLSVKSVFDWAVHCHIFSQGLTLETCSLLSHCIISPVAGLLSLYYVFSSDCQLHRIRW